MINTKKEKEKAKILCYSTLFIYLLFSFLSFMTPLVFFPPFPFSTFFEFLLALSVHSKHGEEKGGKALPQKY